jgi:hypothetical protein
MTEREQKLAEACKVLVEELFNVAIEKGHSLRDLFVTKHKEYIKRKQQENKNV